MFVFISHLTVPEADRDNLERHFRERSRLVDNFPGFPHLQLLTPQARDATHAFLTAWNTREDFRRYMQSGAHAVSHAREPGEIMGRTTVPARFAADEAELVSLRIRAGLERLPAGGVS